jgi:uncharacterized protein (TIGR02466 family)
MAFLKLFPTTIYRGALAPAEARRLNRELAHAALSLADDDKAGRKWSRDNGYRGYTSYASLNDLPQRFPPFADLEHALAPHVAQFAKALDFDLSGGKLALDSLWVNVLEEGGVHTAHIHPHSVVSGTYYVKVPAGGSPLKLEDPRLAMMMAAPPKRARAAQDNRQFVYLQPKAGTLLLWESWLRHEVPQSKAKGARISVSFNYAWH